jgi:predicted house-cleaning noncanonical NTP pyrophosphatase (MazG superfamily)
MRKFTQSDVGKKFRRRNGRVVTCVEVNEFHGYVDFDDGNPNLMKGSTNVGETHNNDIVEEVTKPKIYEEVQKTVTVYVYCHETFQCRGSLLCRIQDDVEELISDKHFHELEDDDLELIETMIRLAREIKAGAK